ncbi:unnamed protein product [Linum tenue]|nr:unnamed protein product [Linum tenue]CAI0390992.1 unnamed protein product [Linum tenue]
MSSKGA